MQLEWGQRGREHLLAQQSLGLSLDLFEHAVLLVPEAVVVCIDVLQELVARAPYLPGRLLLEQLLDSRQLLGCTEVPEHVATWSVAGLCIPHKFVAIPGTGLAFQNRSPD